MMIRKVTVFQSSKCSCGRGLRAGTTAHKLPDGRIVCTACAREAKPAVPSASVPLATRHEHKAAGLCSCGAPVRKEGALTCDACAQAYKARRAVSAVSRAAVPVETQGAVRALACILAAVEEARVIMAKASDKADAKAARAEARIMARPVNVARPEPAPASAPASILASLSPEDIAALSAVLARKVA